MAKVLVTGANGFLGSCFTKKLVELGHETFALVRPSRDLTELNGVHCQYLHGDVTDLGSLITHFRDMDTVFHLAGVIAYKKSQRELMEKVNVEGTRNVVEACKLQQVRKLVHLSSVTAVGAGFTPQDVLNEESPFNVHHLNLGYFETKWQAEQIVKAACIRNEVDAVMLNPSTIYGPGDARKGSRKMQLKVAQGKLKFYTSGGVNVVSVHDVIDGILAAWHKGRTGERYILASENLLIRDLFRIIAEEAGETPPKNQIPNAALFTLGALGDVMEKMGLRGPLSMENAWTSTMYHWFDSTKAQRELGFRPRPSREALRESVRWMKENGLLEKLS